VTSSREVVAPPLRPLETDNSIPREANRQPMNEVFAQTMLVSELVLDSSAYGQMPLIFDDSALFTSAKFVFSTRIFLREKLDHNERLSVSCGFFKGESEQSKVAFHGFLSAGLQQVGSVIA
jgi:hypothetical protein